MSIQWLLNKTHKLSFNVLEHIKVLLFYSFILNNKHSIKNTIQYITSMQINIETYLERDSYLFSNSNSEKKNIVFTFSPIECLNKENVTTKSFNHILFTILHESYINLSLC